MDGLCKLHQELLENHRVLVVAMGEDTEIVLAPVNGKKGSGEHSGPRFWGYVLIRGALAIGADLLDTGRVLVVLDLDETLVLAHTQHSLANRVATLRDEIPKMKALLEECQNPADRPTLEGRAKAYENEKTCMERDLTRLRSFIEHDYVPIEDRIIYATDEPVEGDDGVVFQRQVVRLSEDCVYTRIDPDRSETSMLIRIRPGWQELRKYLVGEGATDRKQRFKVSVCTAAERGYALEAWRLLDPSRELIPPDQRINRVICLGKQKKSLFRALRLGPWSKTGIPRNCMYEGQNIGPLAERVSEMPVAIVVDDRADVWEPRNHEQLIKVRPFLHYRDSFSPHKLPTENDTAEMQRVLNMFQSARSNLYFELQEVLTPHVHKAFVAGVWSDEAENSLLKALDRATSIVPFLSQTYIRPAPPADPVPPANQPPPNPAPDISLCPQDPRELKPKPAAFSTFPKNRQPMPAQGPGPGPVHVNGGQATVASQPDQATASERPTMMPQDPRKKWRAQQAGGVNQKRKYDQVQAAEEQCTTNGGDAFMEASKPPTSGGGPELSSQMKNPPASIGLLSNLGSQGIGFGNLGQGFRGHTGGIANVNKAGPVGNSTNASLPMPVLLNQFPNFPQPNTIQALTVHNLAQVGTSTGLGTIPRMQAIPAGLPGMGQIVAPQGRPAFQMFGQEKPTPQQNVAMIQVVQGVKPENNDKMDVTSNRHVANGPPPSDQASLQQNAPPPSSNCGANQQQQPQQRQQPQVDQKQMPPAQQPQVILAGGRLQNAPQGLHPLTVQHLQGIHGQPTPQQQPVIFQNLMGQMRLPQQVGGPRQLSIQNVGVATSGGLVQQPQGQPYFIIRNQDQQQVIQNQPLTLTSLPGGGWRPPTVQTRPSGNPVQPGLFYPLARPGPAPQQYVVTPQRPNSFQGQPQHPKQEPIIIAQPPSRPGGLAGRVVQHRPQIIQAMPRAGGDAGVRPIAQQTFPGFGHGNQEKAKAPIRPPRPPSTEPPPLLNSGTDENPISHLNHLAQRDKCNLVFSMRPEGPVWNTTVTWNGEVKGTSKCRSKRVGKRLAALMALEMLKVISKRDYERRRVMILSELDDMKDEGTCEAMEGMYLSGSMNPEAGADRDRSRRSKPEGPSRDDRGRGSDMDAWGSGKKKSRMGASAGKMIRLKHNPSRPSDRERTERSPNSKPVLSPRGDRRSSKRMRLDPSRGKDKAGSSGQSGKGGSGMSGYLAQLEDALDDDETEEGEIQE
ncbi:hypothetical protein BSKO_07790 [Bryopsis sp. KO-2023]|nr:hypothetical protein BSKO_07790 [Bryopsis sp. KO-2023]